MNILVIGAGPAGLSFAATMARASRSNRIVVVERNAERENPGWGITLRDHALSFLDLRERLDTQSLAGRSFRWRGDLVVDLPNPPNVHLVTCSRASLIRSLAEICRESGVHLKFEVDARKISESELSEYDLVAAADGAHSPMRRRFGEFFKPTMSHGRNRYAWLAADFPFHKLTIVLRGTHPVLLAWAYKYSGEFSTFIVECSDEVWRREMFGTRSAGDVCATIAKAFTSELDGNAVIAREADRTAWQHFATITCENLAHKNLVLLGDAAHTAHYSQGFGTMLAFDDALALQAALRTARDVQDGLAKYATEQRARTIEFQATALASMQWTEDVLESAERGDAVKVENLIAARWPDNRVTEAPMAMVERSKLLIVQSGCHQAR